MWRSVGVNYDDKHLHANTGSEPSGLFLCTASIVKQTGYQHSSDLDIQGGNRINYFMILFDEGPNNLLPRIRNTLLIQRGDLIVAAAFIHSVAAGILNKRKNKK